MKRLSFAKRGIVISMVGLALFLPARLLYGEFIVPSEEGDGGGGGGGGGGPVIVTTNRTVDWEIPEWEMSGSTPLTYETTDGQLSRIEVRDQTGAVVFSMTQAEIQAMIAQDPSLVAPPAEAQSARVAGPARATAPHAPMSCGGPFTWVEQSIYESSLTFNGDLR